MNLSPPAEITTIPESASQRLRTELGKLGRVEDQPRGPSNTKDDSMAAGVCELEDEAAQVLANAEEFVETTVEIAMDSGCGKHVGPPKIIEGYAVVPSAASRQGRHFIGAGGDRIKNLGQ